MQPRTEREALAQFRPRRREQTPVGDVLRQPGSRLYDPARPLPRGILLPLRALAVSFEVGTKRCVHAWRCLAPRSECGVGWI